VSEQKKIPIIGIGDDGLDGLPPSTRSLLEQADVLIGDERTLELVQQLPAERVAAGGNPDATVELVRSLAGRSPAILAYGDPLFYGLARYLCDKLGKERFAVVPHVSSMQMAFARVMESWEDAYLTNLANHSLDSVIERIRTAGAVGMFTTDTVTPAAVASALLERQIDYFSAYVCENLGQPDERVTQGELTEIASRSFSPLNVMILVRKPDVPDRPTEMVGQRLFGNPDEAFLQSRPKQGLLTPAEVRAQALAELDLGPRSIIWDVGAGSGSVSIEAAQLARDGTAYAIEMEAEDHELIKQNAARFGVKNVVPVLGMAPEAWQDLPDPDAVFAQGVDREISRLVDLALRRLRPGGRLVASVASVDNLADLQRTMSSHSSHVRVWMINIARGNYQLARLRFEALNPTFLLSLRKEE